jgi:hypothetical protein
MLPAFILLLQLLAATRDAPASTGTSGRDAEVVNAVLTELTTYTGAQQPLSLNRAVPRTIYVTLMPPPGLEPIDNKGLMDEVLSVESRAMSRKVRQAEKNTRWDRTQPHGLEGLHSLNARIVVSVGIESADYQSKYPISMWPLGYSEDGSIAVVKLWFPEIMHPSAAVFVVEKTSGGWSVRSRAFQTFL